MDKILLERLKYKQHLTIKRHLKIGILKNSAMFKTKLGMEVLNSLPQLQVELHQHLLIFKQNQNLQQTFKELNKVHFKEYKEIEHNSKVNRLDQKYGVKVGVVLNF